MTSTTINDLMDGPTQVIEPVAIPAGITVRVYLESVGTNWRDIAERRGYDTAPFDAITVDGAQYGWQRVKPLTGKHCAEIDLPPIFTVTPVD